jgi:hypothetical protein
LPPRRERDTALNRVALTEARPRTSGRPHPAKGAPLAGCQPVITQLPAPQQGFRRF